MLFEKESQKRNFVKGKRDPLRIILYILRFLSSGPGSITHVAYKANLNHLSAQRYLWYLSLLEGRGFLQRVLSTEGRTFWITQRGLVAMKDLMRAVEDFWSPLEVTTQQETQP